MHGCSLLCLVPQDNPGPSLAALVVTFYPPNAKQVVPELLLSPAVERLNVCLSLSLFTLNMVVIIMFVCLLVCFGMKSYRRQ